MIAITNGNVMSVNMNGEFSYNESIVIKDDKIVFVGNSDNAMEIIEENTEIIDVKGATVLPGFCDAHVHPTFSGSVMFTCNLFGLTLNGEKGDQEDKIRTTLKKYIEENEDKKIIRGRYAFFTHLPFYNFLIN